MERLSLARVGLRARHFNSLQYAFGNASLFLALNPCKPSQTDLGGQREPGHEPSTRQQARPKVRECKGCTQNHVGMGENETIRGPQVLVFVSIYQGSLLSTYLGPTPMSRTRAAAWISLPGANLHLKTYQVFAFLAHMVLGCDICSPAKSSELLVV